MVTAEEIFQDVPTDELIYHLKKASNQKYYEQRIRELRKEIIDDIIVEASAPRFIDEDENDK